MPWRIGWNPGMPREDRFQDLTYAGNLSPGETSRVLNDLIPSPDATHDLGSASLRWKNAYFSGDVSLAGSLTAAVNPTSIHDLFFADAYSSGTATAPSLGPTVATESASGGSIDTATYYYVITYYNRNGETTQSAVTSFACSAGSTNTVYAAVNSSELNWRLGARKYRVYVGQSSVGPFYLQTPSINAVDTTGHVVPGDIILTSLTFSGTQPPSTNTATIDALQVALNATLTSGSPNNPLGALIVTGTHTLTTPLVMANQQRIIGIGSIRQEGITKARITSTWTDDSDATVILCNANSFSAEGLEIVGAGHAVMLHDMASGGGQNVRFENCSFRSTDVTDTYSSLCIRGIWYNLLFRDVYMRGGKAAVHCKYHSGGWWKFSGSRWDLGGSNGFLSESSVTDPDRSANRSGFPNGAGVVVLEDLFTESGTGIIFDFINVGGHLVRCLNADPTPSASTASVIRYGVDANGNSASGMFGSLQSCVFQNNANYGALIKIESNTGNTFTHLNIANTSNPCNVAINFNSVNVPVKIDGGAGWEADEGSSPVRYSNFSGSGQYPTLSGTAYDGTADTSHAMNTLVGGTRFVQHNVPTTSFYFWWSGNGIMTLEAGDPDTAANHVAQFLTTKQTNFYNAAGTGTLFRVDARSGVDIVQVGGNFSPITNNSHTLGTGSLQWSDLRSVLATFSGKTTHSSEVEIDGALNHDGTTVGFYGTTPVTQAAAIASLTGDAAGTANGSIQTLTDPGDTPASADALRDDLVANLIPELRNNIDELRVKVNALATALRNVGIVAP